MRFEAFGNGTHVLCRCDHEHDVAGGKIGQRSGCTNDGIERHSREEHTIGVLGVDLFGDCGLARP